MTYTHLSQCLDDLERHGQLVRIDQEIDPHLEMGAIQRRVFQAGGPALLFTRVKGCSFPMAGNIFGTVDRIRFIFRKTLPRVRRVLAAKADPSVLLKRPWQVPSLALAAYHALPRKVFTGPILEHETTLSDLPQLVSWPMDGGPYVTLPQVYTHSPQRPGMRFSNMGMYRVQLAGNEFVPNKEVGLHYQICRGIGVHHAEAIEKSQALRVNIFVGGPPAMTLAAIMPLPENLPELFFAGMLAGHRIPMVTRSGHLPMPAQADFCISGIVDPHAQKPEGPFGDHLGYYSLTHPFPVLKVTSVLHRPHAIWPFTTVGRPPQEDTIFGTFIHELTRDLVPTVFSGIHQVHAVDAAGVHPLLLALGSERYVPYAPVRKPRELVTNGLALLGSTQTSLAKYLFIAAREDDLSLSCHHVPAFFRHVLERLDPTRDLHFVTKTTMDTLDYSGTGLNEGSKVMWTVAGPPVNRLATQLPTRFHLPGAFTNPRVFEPGMLVIQGPRHQLPRDTADPLVDVLCNTLQSQGDDFGFPLLVIVDDPDFTTRTWDNFLWVTFTRSDPATDIYGVGSFIRCKHWGCTGPVIIDARIKSFHAPLLDPDPAIEKKVDALGAPGGPLHGII
ncbi:UbiD family decarboxylase [Desulfoplanes formicivorans]|uniref:3-octaprenyl-4-hydroxybenzoate carboxy-lyase n=1 Tax=Desulfoplanes formicivorans TaxID=1592317 RepID=A0A194AF66_9BACT|nr:UbiD family decarboxylase [Desulfoplanes formicivorans]GAU08712.1 3-octaprenyl-4-hydroxybenzoate carboxy-lyase [Desulfoplanes formicivorans]